MNFLFLLLVWKWKSRENINYHSQIARDIQSIYYLNNELSFSPLSVKMKEPGKHKLSFSNRKRYSKHILFEKTNPSWSVDVCMLNAHHLIHMWPSLTKKQQMGKMTIQRCYQHENQWAIFWYLGCRWRYPTSLGLGTCGIRVSSTTYSTNYFIIQSHQDSNH